MQAKSQQKKIKFNNKPFDFILCIMVFLLLALGIVMVLSASAPSSLSTTGSSYTYVVKQAVFAAIGVVLMLIISRIDYRNYKKLYKIAYILSIFALLSVVIPGIGKTVNGAKRWVDLGFGTFQPSELAKIGLIVFYAAYLADHKNDLPSFWKGFVKPLLFLIPPIAILFKVQNHLSASLVIVGITCIMMIMAGTKFRYFATIGVAGAGAGLGALVLIPKIKGEESFRLQRLITFLNPFEYKQDEGWQVVQGLYAIGSRRAFWSRFRSKQTKVFIHTRAT